MKNKFIKSVNSIVLPLCFIMICMSFFRDYVTSIPNSYILIIRITILIGAIAMIISGIVKPRYKSKNIYKGKNIKETFYINSFIIIEKIFTWYFILYIILRLDRVSILFSFIMLVLFGIYYGYRIANSANRYKK